MGQLSVKHINFSVMNIDVKIELCNITRIHSLLTGTSDTISESATNTLSSD